MKVKQSHFHSTASVYDATSLSFQISNEHMQCCKRNRMNPDAYVKQKLLLNAIKSSKGKRVLSMQLDANINFYFPFMTGIYIYTYINATLLRTPFQLLLMQISYQPITRQQLNAFRHVGMVKMNQALFKRHSLPEGCC